MTDVLELFGESTTKFEALNRHLVLVTQSEILDYLKANFAFDHVDHQPRRRHAMQFHAYSFSKRKGVYALKLASRMSTDAEGVGWCLGLNAEPKVGMDEIVQQLERKLSPETLLQVA